MRALRDRYPRVAAARQPWAILSQALRATGNRTLLSFLVPVFFLLVCVAAARAEDATARQKIEGMTPGEKEQLQRLEERFEALDPAEQQRLRELHEHLEKDADAEQLRQIMQRYHEWLKTLPAYSRAELADLNPADRVKWIQKRMQEEQKRQGGKPLGPKDAEKLLRWLNESLGKQEESWLKGLPEQQRKRLMEMSPPMRHRMMVWQMIQRWQSAGVVGPPPMMSDDDLTRLRGELGPEAQNASNRRPRRSNGGSWAVGPGRPCVSGQAESSVTVRPRKPTTNGSPNSSRPN